MEVFGILLLLVVYTVGIIVIYKFCQMSKVDEVLKKYKEKAKLDKLTKATITDDEAYQLFCPTKYRLASVQIYKDKPQFAIEVEGIRLNNLTIETSKAGVKFVRLPTKYTGTQYFTYYFVKFSPKFEKEIIEKVEFILDKNKEV